MLAITADDADVNWLNHKRCGEKSKCSIPHMQDPHPTDPHVIRTKQRTFPSRSKNVDAWHPNSQNPLLPAPELFAVSDPKQKCRTKPGMEDCFSSLFAAPVKSLKSVSQALAQRCFCFKNSPTSNLKQGKSYKNLASLVNIHIHLEVQTNQNSEFQLEPQKTMSWSESYNFNFNHLFIRPFPSPISRSEFHRHGQGSYLIGLHTTCTTPRVGQSSPYLCHGKPVAPNGMAKWNMVWGCMREV